DGYATPNPGQDNSRFSPFDDESSGERVPSIYLAESLEASLLETSLHDVPIKTPREVNVSTLFGKAHARVRLPTDLLIADLRDASLRTLGIERDAIVSSPREHNPCTRRVAKRIHSSMQDVAGIVWHSRQAEINQRPAGKCSSPSLIACPLSAVAGSSCPIDHRSARCSKVLGGCLSIGSQLARRHTRRRTLLNLSEAARCPNSGSSHRRFIRARSSRPSRTRRGRQ